MVVTVLDYAEQQKASNASARYIAKLFLSTYKLTKKETSFLSQMTVGF